MIVTCANPSSWHPTIHRNETHHNPPKSWTTDDGASSKLWDICGLCHNEIHALLNQYIKADGLPPWTVRVSYSPWIRDRAKEAWAQRRTDIPKMPYTTNAGTA